MKSLCFSVAMCFLVGASALTARASDTITSQFPSTTFAVVHLDIAEIDVEAVAKLLPEDARLRFKRQLQGVLGQLSSAGLTDVYVSMDLASLIPPKPVMVTNAGVQMTDAMKPMLGAISETLFPGEELEVQLSSGRVYVGTKQAVQRFRSPNATVDLSSALDSDFDHAVVLRWNPQTADTFSQIWPQQLPLGNGVSINASMLAKQIESVAIEFSLPPNESARLSLQPREGTDLNAIREQLNPVARMIQDDFQIEISGSTDPGELTWELKSGQSAVIADLIRDLRGSAQQSQTMNDLKQVLLAFHNHYSVHGEFPKDISREGEALLSWRVKVLPFLDQSALYQTFDVTKSWDDTANQVPAKMVVPTYSKQEDAKTQIRLPVCKGSIWDGDGKITFDKMIDGTSNTIAVIIAPQSAATSWTQPGYFRLNEQDLVGSVFGDQDRLIAGFADGSVQVFTRDEMSEERLRAMLTFAGREMFKR